MVWYSYLLKNFPQFVVIYTAKDGEALYSQQKQDRELTVAQMVKNLPVVQRTWVQSLVWEDPLERGMATHSTVLAWRIPWTEEPGRLQSWGHKESDTTEQRIHIMYTKFV